MPFSEKHCIQLSMQHLSLWTTAIQDGVATVHAPPDNNDFNSLKMIHGMQISKKKAESPRVVTAMAGAVATAPQVIYIPTPAPPPPPIHLQTPQRPTLNIDDVSPVRKFEPQEYNDQALRAYLQYLTDKYQDDDFLAAFCPLNQAKIGVDLIKSHLQSREMRADLDNMLKENQSIPLGIRKRIVMDFPKWEASLPRREISETSESD